MTRRINSRAEEKKQIRKLIQQLKRVPVVTVTGVVSPSFPVGGSRSQKERLWTFSFEFDAWRIKGGETQTWPLRIRRRVDDRALHSLMEKIKRNQVVRIRARIVEKSSFQNPQGYLEQCLGIVTDDEELNQLSAALQKPVRFKDKQLGMFRYDRADQSYAAKPDWCGKRIQLFFLDVADPKQAITAYLDVSRGLWNKQKHWKRRVELFSAENLLPLANEWRRQENGMRKKRGDPPVPDVTMKQFLSKIKLELITIAANQSFTFVYNDGDIFWGHSIGVRGNLTDGPTSADVSG